jgi:very-short-patch-repair endonuclease
MRFNPTPSERRFNNILNSLNRGVLRGQFIRQYAVSGEYIVDVFFPKIRLAIEIDGSIHDEYLQYVRDQAKDEYCARIDITVLRLTNNEVWGDRERLVDRLRDGWRAALRRENRIIGKAYGGVKI